MLAIVVFEEHSTPKIPILKDKVWTVARVNDLAIETSEGRLERD
jgi:hypothetical protein